MYKLYLFWVYLRSKALAIIAIGVVALCVFMMLISVSTMTGFLWKVERAARGLFGDVVIESRGLAGLGSYDELIAELPAAVPEVEAATPFIISYGILRVPNTDYRQTVQIAGIRLPQRARVSDFENGLFVQSGDPDPTFAVSLEKVKAAVDADDEAIENIIRREQKRQFNIVIDRSALDATSLRKFRLLMEDDTRLTVEDMRFLAALPHRDETKLSGRDATALSEARDLLTKAESTFTFRVQRDRLIAYTRLLGPKIDALSAALQTARKDGPTSATVESLAEGLDLLEKAAQNARGILLGAPQAAGRLLPGIRRAMEAAKTEGPSDETVDALETCVTSLGDFVIDEPAHRVILGIGIQGLSYRTGDGETIRHLSPGNKISLVVLPLGQRLSGGVPPTPNLANFTVIDDSRSDVSSIDSRTVYIPFGTLQQMCNMGPEYAAKDPSVMLEPARCSQVHIKVRPGIDREEDLRAVAAKVRAFYKQFAETHLTGSTQAEVLTWRQMQSQVIGPLQQQRTLTYIIFTIISVVSVAVIFVILYVIAVQKTRDMGVLKSVGASGAGMASIFFAYGAVIGAVGWALGTFAGYHFVTRINEVQDFADATFGYRLWSRETYMFDHIPNEVDWTAAMWILAGAVLFGILGAIAPAWRAGRMQAVEALRYE